MSTYLRVASDLNADKPVLYSKFGIKCDGKAFDAHEGIGADLDKTGCSSGFVSADTMGNSVVAASIQAQLGLTISTRWGARATV